jgi:hypothetical protein
MHRNVHQLLARVATRRRLAAWCSRSYLTLLVLLAAYGVAILTIRLAGVMTDWSSPWLVLLLPVVALLVAALWSLWRSPADLLGTARLVDQCAGTKDLFLTRVQLDQSAGGFQPLVVAAADQAAAQLAVRHLVPWRGGRRVLVAAACMFAALLGTWLVPQLDPFGRRSAEVARDTTRRAQAQNRAAAQQRLQALTKQDVTAEHSKPVTEAVLALQKALQGTRPKNPENQKQLAQEQKALGEQWRAFKQDHNQKGAHAGDQKLGGMPDPRARAWSEALRAGDVTPLERELDELRKKAAELGQAGGADQEKQRQALAERLLALRDFARKEAGDPDLRDALARALQDLATSEQDAGDAGLALANLDQELALAQLELERLAQSARDLAQLERALETLQLAKALDQQDALDGEASQCKSLAEYREAFRKALAERLAALARCPGCEGKGEGCSECDGAGSRPAGACAACNGKGKGCGQCGGTGRASAEQLAAQLALEQLLGSGGRSGPNRGQAQGGNVGERPDAQAGFTPERTRAALVAGRTLMQLKQQEPAQGGLVRVDRDAALRAVRAAVGEAILKEDVPPGYHDAVKGYFDKTGSGK